MADIVKFPRGSGTPEKLFEDLIDDPEIEKAVVVVFKNDGTHVSAYWSDMDTKELSFASSVLQWELFEEMAGR